MTRNPLSAYTLDQLRERRSVKWRTYDPDVLPLFVAETDTELAEPISTALIEAIRRGDTGYAMPGRLPEVFAAFAGRRYGWRPDPAETRLMVDVMNGVVETLQRLTAPGARVVINTPVYHPFFFWLGQIGREIVESPLDAGFRIDLDRLERDFAAGADVYLLCSPHNPTGTVHTREELQAVADLAERYGVRVLADEIHAPLVYPGAVHSPFPALDGPAAARSIAFVSATKAWNLPGLKAALAVPGRAAAADLDLIPEQISYKAALPGVIASEAAFEHGEPWLAELLIGLGQNRELLGELLAERLPGVGYHVPQGTFLAWLDCRELGLGDDPAATFLDKGRVAVYSGLPFGEPGRGFVRINFATSPELLTEAVDRMAAAL